MPPGRTIKATIVRIKAGDAVIDGDLKVPHRATGLVVFPHGSGSSRFSPRNRSMAHVFEHGGFATLLLDLLTRDEEVVDARTGAYQLDLERLTHRVIAALDWLAGHPDVSRLPVACCGASTGAAAALIAAALRPALVRAVISRGGRPDLAGDALARVQAPTLLIVGGNDRTAIELNRAATRHMRGAVQIDIVPGATNLFEESGALERVSQLALKWCWRHLR
jgi:pimeloyl-ACP methyl ester carboxylesterase